MLEAPAQPLYVRAHGGPRPVSEPDHDRNEDERTQRVGGEAPREGEVRHAGQGAGESAQARDESGDEHRGHPVPGNETFHPVETGRRRPEEPVITMEEPPDHTGG